MPANRPGTEAVESLARGQSGILLRDGTGQEARIVPGLGANLVGLRLAARGQPHELLIPVPDATDRPSVSYGAPVLFPYPNRVRDARFTFGGRTFELPAAPSGHAVHGLVRELPFKLIEHHGQEAGALARCLLDSADHPQLRAHYPFDFRLTITYRLTSAGLRTEAEVENSGADPMPFGLGFHPYFRLPLEDGGERARCRVLLWGPRIWELNGDQLPTGRILPVPAELDLRGYPALGQNVLDTLYTGLALDDPGAGTWSGRYLDPTAGVEVVVTADEAFREAVIFAPTARAVISLEPYTGATDMFNLATRGLDAGLLVLAPGARWVAGYSISLRGIDFAERP